MKEIIIATKNKGKAKEFEQMFAPRGIKVLTFLDFPELEDVEETGNEHLKRMQFLRQKLFHEN